MGKTGIETLFSVLAICFASWGCSTKDHNPSPSQAGASTTGGHGGTSSAGGQGGTSSARPDAGGAGGSCTATATAPSAWVRPAQCNGVGNLCSEGCQGAACQLEGNVCVPFSRIGASPDACMPYCLAYACMTFDEASCFCTGSSAAQAPACACGPKAVAGICAPQGGSCASKPCCDCMGLMCVNDSVSGTVCRQPCSKNSDCVTGCCNTTAASCQDALYCNCAKLGETRDGGNSPCCPGTTCLTFSADVVEGPFSCYQDCVTQSDCPSGCCSQMISGLDHGACGPCH